MPNDDQPYSGKPCQQPGCDGFLGVESTKVRGDNRRRYFKCKKCGRAPENNVQSVPLKYAPLRIRQPKSPIDISTATPQQPSVYDSQHFAH